MPDMTVYLIMVYQIISMWREILKSAEQLIQFELDIIKLEPGGEKI